MAWTERQQTLLRAMGLRVFGAPVWPVDAPVAEPVIEHPAPASSAAAVAGAVEEGALVAAAGAAAATPAHLAPSTKRPPAGRAAAAAWAPAGIEVDPAAGGADRGAVASLDWPALRTAVAGCTACGLAATRTQTVFGVGHERAHWMVVGEAPGENEDRLGEPFVGAAGQLLDRMLAALQLARRDPPQGELPAPRRVFITNTLKCRPPGNRNPAPQELQRCEPFLVRQIELVQPRVILALGAYAARALLRSELPVGKLRGQVHRWRGIPLVVSYHPAYLLRSPGEKARAWDDLCLAANMADDGGA